jgi:hypothetical protein
MLVTSSGMLVPKATIVAPMTTGGTPALTAMYEAESTMKKALAITPEAPTNAKNT